VVRLKVGGEQLELSWDEWEARVRSGRVPPDAQVWIDAVTGGTWAVAGDLDHYRSLRDEAALAWRDRFVAGPPPLLTAALVGFELRIWWWAWNLEPVRAGVLALLTNKMPGVLEDRQIWRPLTMGFVHTDPFHVAMNLLWLGYTGWNIERALGRANLATLYVASVVVGSILSMFGAPQTSALGASGGVFGLIAASVVFGLREPDLLPARGRRLYGLAMLPYLVVMFWNGLFDPRTDNWSHFGGLVCGGLLALVIDPVGLERRAGWNRRVRATLFAGLAVVLLTLGLAGPYLVPLGPPEVVRARALDRPVVPRPDDAPPISPVWEVPRSWRPGVDAARRPAFVSPVAGGRLRTFGVRAREHDHPITPEVLAADFVTDVRAEWPDARLSTPVATTLAGMDGLEIVAHVDSLLVPLVVTWRGTTRGVASLEETWQVDEPAARRLAPLAARLRATVAWPEPAELVAARADVEAAPGSATARRTLAAELARAGAGIEALALHDALVSEKPEDVARTVELLHTVALLQPPDAAARWDAALVAHPVPVVVVAVADGLDEAGRTNDAVGLLDIAWDDHPGDVKLRRARRSRDLSVLLDPETGGPWDLRFDPTHGQPRDPAWIERRRARTLTLAEASRAAQDHAAERTATIAAAVAGVQAGSSDAVVPLLVLKEGGIPPAGDAEQGLAEDLGSARGGSKPVWMPPEVFEAVRARPDAVVVLEQTLAR
jgi:membrane associated rhomboid family serine protease